MMLPAVVSQLRRRPRHPTIVRLSIPPGPGIGPVVSLLEELRREDPPPPQKLPAPFVFISARGSDYQYARRVDELLAAWGCNTFFAEHSVADRGSANYRRSIDEALERADHLVVVASSGENARWDWVEYEWGFFASEKLSKRKLGNLVTVTAAAMQPSDLPPGLRYYQVIPLDERLDQLRSFVQPVAPPEHP
jgi:hypothetical protein